MNIIGLDAAVQDKNIGCVRGTYHNGSFTLTEKWDRKGSLEDLIAGWVKESGQTVLAIDAPLGWPVTFRKILNTHCAGRPVETDPELFFKRKTDLNVRQRFKKWPLEISADRIARTAFFTLKRIGGIERRLEAELPLLWSMDELRDYGMVEVYPAATILANGFSVKGYKKDNTDIRNTLYDALKTGYDFSNPGALDLTSIEHDFDAFICCLACIDFIEGQAVAPEVIDRDMKEEGWIWVKGN